MRLFTYSLGENKKDPWCLWKYYQLYIYILCKKKANKRMNVKTAKDVKRTVCVSIETCKGLLW